jgi:hypothetical protein
MRTLELADTGVEVCGLAVVSAPSLLGAFAGAVVSCAVDDNPTSISANRAAEPTTEVVFMSASSFISSRGPGCVQKSLEIWEATRTTAFCTPA